MIGTKTDATVTKISEKPERYYEPQEKENTDGEINTVKTGGKLINAAAYKINKVSETLCEKCAPIKNVTIEKAKRTSCRTGKAVSNVRDSVSFDGKKIFFAVKKVASESRKKLSCLLEKAKNYVMEKGSDKFMKLAIAAGITVVFAVICVSTCSLGYKVTVGDTSLGMISDKEMLKEVMNELSEDVFAVTGEEFILSAEPKVSLGITLNRNMLSHEVFSEKLKSVSPMMIPAYTVVIDDEMVVALPNEEMAKSAVEEYKNSFFENGTEAEIDFANDVKISYMFVPKYILHTKDSAVSYLSNGEFSYYMVDSEQTVSELAERTGVTEEAILRSNKIENDTVKTGQVLKLYTGRMFADVMALERVKREETIPFETVQKDSSELYQGITKIETAGEEGVKAVEECVTYINGVETKRDILEESVLKAPQVQVELVGTKEPPPSVGTGDLAMPTSGSLSSRFGSRWGRQHEGIDLCASVGTPIYAADNGTVTYAQFNDGGYGYMVRIDHGNGLETYYAHCSELLVETGQVVAKGDLIAKVGNTGRSTGAHLHFEVRQDGAPIDPMAYID